MGTKKIYIENTGTLIQKYIKKYNNIDDICGIICWTPLAEHTYKTFIYNNPFYNKKDCIIYKINDFDKLNDIIYNIIEVNMNSSDNKDIKFALIGNPPYQGDINSYGRGASAIWYKFMMPFYENKNINEMVMIIPSKILYGGGKGLSNFSQLFLTGQYIKKLKIYPYSRNIFPDVKIIGGVCIVNMDKNINTEKTGNNLIDIKVVFGNYVEETTRSLLDGGKSTFVLFEKLNRFINKLYNKDNNFSKLINSRSAFGFQSNFYKHIKYSETKTDYYSLRITGYVLEENKRKELYINEQEALNNNKLLLNSSKSNVYVDFFKKYKNSYKLCVSCSKSNFYNTKSFPIKGIISTPFICKSNEIVSESYLCIICNDENHAYNIKSYMETKFFKALLYTKALTQHLTRECFEYVPLQDFTKIWSDEKLYDLYKSLFDDKEYKEIWDFINMMVD